MANPLYQKHIISINDLSRDDLNLVLATAAKLKANPQPELLKHKVIASCFFEASTRTSPIQVLTVLSVTSQIRAFSVLPVRLLRRSMGIFSVATIVCSWLTYQVSESGTSR